MSIWTYKYESSDKPWIEAVIRNRASKCVFCETPMIYALAEQFETSEYPRHHTERVVRYCALCGWWALRQDSHGTDNAGAYAFTNTHGAIGSLMELDLQDRSVAIDDARAYLAVRFEKRADLHPKTCEEVVASVYRDLGYLDVRVTGCSNDGGIDIIMEGPNDSLVGVQVKRYRNKIGVEQIRAFTGALAGC